MTADEDRVIAEAERVARRADLERRSPDTADAVDAVAGLLPHQVRFCTGCDQDMPAWVERHCPQGEIVAGVPPHVRCLPCYSRYHQPDVCDAVHPWGQVPGCARVMNPDAEAIEALLLAGDHSGAIRLRDRQVARDVR